MRRKYEPAGERIPNLAPMVDVIMVLLIFFLLGASMNLVTEGVLQTTLDPSSGPGGEAKAQIVPTITIALGDVNEGQSAAIYVMDQPLPDGDFAELRKFLGQRIAAGADPKNAVVIGPETAVRWKYVIHAMDAAVRAGFRNVQFSVSFKAGTVGG